MTTTNKFIFILSPKLPDNLLKLFNERSDNNNVRFMSQTFFVWPITKKQSKTRDLHNSDKRHKTDSNFTKHKTRHKFKRPNQPTPFLTPLAEAEPTPTQSFAKRDAMKDGDVPTPIITATSS